MSLKWNEVPEGNLSQWRQIFGHADANEGINLSEACPVCGQKTLHRYYWLVKTQPRELRGLMFKGPGSCWEWCSSCGAYEHSEAYVPLSWTAPSLPIDHSALTVVPDLIQEALDRVQR